MRVDRICRPTLRNYFACNFDADYEDESYQGKGYCPADVHIHHAEILVHYGFGNVLS